MNTSTTPVGFTLSDGAQKLLMWTFIISALASAVWHLTWVPFAAAAVGGLVANPNRPVLARVVVVSLIFLSSFVYLPGGSKEYRVFDYGGGSIFYTKGNFSPRLYIPFVTTVEAFVEKQDIVASKKFTEDTLVFPTCIGVTADKVAIQAAVEAELKLPFDGLADAYRRTGNESTLQSRAKGELCERFRLAVLDHQSERLPSALALELRTAAEKKEMNSLGLQYSGTIRVQDIHAYVAQ